MSHSNMAGALRQCITHLEGLLQDDTPVATRNSWLLCCRGLRAMMRNWERYQDNIVTARDFLHFFVASVEQMHSCLARLCKEGDETQVVELEDIIFALTEEMAVLIRERGLRAGYSRLSDDERKIMDFFESSGQWFLGDGTMVSDHYYVKVPTGVIADFTRGSHKKISAPAITA